MTTDVCLQEFQKKRGQREGEKERKREREIERERERDDRSYFFALQVDAAE